MSEGTKDESTTPDSSKSRLDDEVPEWTLKRMFLRSTPIDRGDKDWTPIGTQPKSSSDPDWRGVVRENVIELPIPEPYKFGQPVYPGYFWFDSPDYADPFKKLGFLLKYSLLFSGLIGTLAASFRGINVCMKSNYVILKTHVLPWTGSLMAGGTTVIAVANLRGKKDDTVNYLIGGAVTGMMIGRQSWKHTLRCVPIFASFAIYTKWMMETNQYLMPVVNWKFQNNGLYGLSAEHGLKSGDLRFGLRVGYGDPGRDVRTFDT